MFKNIYQNKKVIITGNTGFKGAWLSVWLLKLGAKVYGISKDIPTNPSIFEVCNLKSHLHYFELDIRDNEKLMNVITSIEPDYIFHLAAQPIVSESYQNPIDTFTSNIIGTANVLECLRKINKPCKAIIITSDKCYENVEWTWGYRENDRLGGKDPYSASKGAAELIIHSYYESFFKNESSNVQLVSVRAGNVIGGGDWALNRIVPDAMRSWSKKQSVIIRSPQATRPWQHVLEPLSGYLVAGMKLTENKNLSGESFNFGPNADQNHTVLELLNELSKHWNFSNDFNTIEIQPSIQFHEAGLLKLNCDKALHMLNWKPVWNFEDTTKYTSQWYFDYYNNHQVNIEYLENQLNEYLKSATNKNLEWTI
ncbi:MAG: CDP-glucose 4,6-dehydratase [Bacteroidia bacterium]